MIRLLELLKEVMSSKDTYTIDKSIIDANKKAKKFIESNKDKILQLMADNDYMTLYNMVLRNVKTTDQAKLLQAFNNQLVSVTSKNINIRMPFDNDNNIDISSTVQEIEKEVSKWVKKNRNKLIKLADDDNYKEFYNLIKKQFPNAEEWKLVMAMNMASIEHDIHYEWITD